MKLALGPEDGYTLVELLTVLLILGVVLSGMTALFVSGSRAEIDMNERFQAQQNARLALSKLRTEVHRAGCADVGAGPNVPATGSSVALLRADCSTVRESWCTAELGPGRFGLFRQAGGGCDAATGLLVADHLVAGEIFTFHPPQLSPARLARLEVALHVDADPTDARAAFRLEDALVLRSSRGSA